MRNTPVIWFCLMMAAVAQCTANDQPFPSTEAVAEAFHFPISRLQVTNASKEASSKLDGRAVEAWVFTSSEKVFAAVNSVLADGGVILTEELKNEFESKLTAARPDESLPFKRVQVGDATGYAGLAGFGPGGAALAVRLHLPAQNQDLQITVNIPFMDRSDVPEDLSHYVRLFSGTGGDMLKSLIHVSSNAVQIVAARAPMIPRLKGPERPRLPVAPALSPTTTSIPAQPIHARVPNTGSTSETDHTISETGKPRRFTWMHLIGAVVMVGVLLWYFRAVASSRSRKPS